MAGRVRVRGVTHLSLAVRDPGRSLAFYGAIFGVEEPYRDSSSVQLFGPGPHDCLSFEKRPRAAGKKADSTTSASA